MDRKAILKKMLMGPIDWITMTPFLAGSTLGLGLWAVDSQSGPLLAASIAPLLLSIGIYFHRLLFNWDSNYQRIVDDWRSRVEEKRDRDLDNLYRDLKKDGDPRTEVILKDLRTLTKALVSEQSDTFARVAYDVVSDVDKLFQRSVDYLRESLELWHTAEAMERQSIKEELLAHREILIREVDKSLDDLGEILAHLKRAAVNSPDGHQMAELREDLAARLAIAERVEKRVQALRFGTVSEYDEDKYLQHAEK